MPISPLHNFASRSQTIDCLRGIAALLVVVMHVSEAYAYFVGINGGINGLHALAQQAQFGVLGVTLFFAISGYLIPSSIHGTRLAGLKKFAVRRFFRLYPLFWLSIPFGVLTTWWLWDKPISAHDVALNFTMLAGALNAPFVQGLYWTLQIELLFYVLCAGLFVLRPSLLRNANFLLGLAILFFAWYVWPSVRGVVFDGAQVVGANWRMFRVNLSIMFWAAGLRALHQSQAAWRRSPLLYVYLLLWLVWCLGFNLLFAHLTLPLGRALFGAWFAAIGLFMLCVVAQRPRGAALAYLGKISYSIYLFHPVVLYALLWWLQHAAPTWASGLPMAAYVLWVIALTIALSAGLYKYVEQPSMALGKKLSQ